MGGGQPRYLKAGLPVGFAGDAIAGDARGGGGGGGQKIFARLDEGGLARISCQDSHFLKVPVLQSSTQKRAQKM